MARSETSSSQNSEDGQLKRSLVLGDFRALEPSFLEEIRRLRAADPLRPIIILVTSHLLGLHLQRYLPSNGLNHINLRFLTIEDFAERVGWRSRVGAGKRPMPEAAATEIIRIACRGLAESHKDFYFRAIAERRGFHEAALATIGDLKNAGLGPKHLKKAAGDSEAAHGLNASKVRDLVRIWDVYEQTLAEHDWLDRNDILRLAVELVHEDEIFRDALAVIAYGFYDFNQLERDILKACFESRATTLFVPYEEKPAFEYARPTVEWLGDQGFERRAAAGAADADPAPIPRAPALAHLADRVFSGGDPAPDGDDTISIISAPGELREVRELTRSIVGSALKGDMALWECAILPRAPESYTGLITETARGLGHRPYVPDGLPLSGTRAGRSLILMLDILRDDYGRRSVMEFATFARLRPPFAEADESANRTAAWDVISMEAGIVGGEDEWTERLEKLLGSVSREYDETESGWRRTVPGGPDAVKALKDFLRVLAGAIAPVVERPTWGGKVEAAGAALCALVEDDIAMQEDESANGTRTPDVNWTQEVLGAMGSLTALDDLADTGGPDARLELEDFCDAVTDMLESTSSPIGRFQRNGPAVIPLMRARGIPFKTVVMPGMVEKQFPPAVRQDAILLDHEREAINRAVSGSETGPVPLKSRRRLEEERLLFRLAAGAATERLILTFPRLEMVTAKERLPSSFLLATVEAITGERTDFEGLERFKGFTRVPLSRIASENPADALDLVEFDLSRALGDLRRRKPDSILTMREASKTFARALDLEAERWGKRTFTCYDGFICTKDARKELKDCYSIIGKEVSPTRLETFATCPYQYLLGNIMDLEDLVEPEHAHELSPLDRGALVHDILYKFLTELASRAGTAGSGQKEAVSAGVSVKEKDRKLLHEIAAREFADFAEHGITGFPALWTLEKERMLEWLDGFFDEEVESAEWQPAYFEVRYGMKSKGPLESHISTDEPVPLTFGKHRVLLRGKIDRVDLSDDGKRARVVDYKTGKAYARPNDMGGGTSLQLPLYLHAVSSVLKGLHKGIKADHAQYYHLKEGASKRHIRFDSEALETGRAELDTILGTIADYIEAGYFFAVPGGQCEWCDFLSICGSARETVFDMKSGDPSIKAYLAMTGETEEDAGEEAE